ncbi:MAG TPA: hypothetical protein VJI33_00920 [Candidatus Paceibacterota bacterium]
MKTKLTVETLPEGFGRQIIVEGDPRLFPDLLKMIRTVIKPENHIITKTFAADMALDALFKILWVTRTAKHIKTFVKKEKQRLVIMQIYKK